jgi:hypothetical protein
LAVADLCVGVFCVYQNFFTYVVSKWVRQCITPLISWFGTACVGGSEDGVHKCRNMFPPCSVNCPRYWFAIHFPSCKILHLLWKTA